MSYERVKRFTQIHTAGGIDTATIRVTVDEMEKYSRAAGWVDVCKGWYVNDERRDES